MRLKTPVRLAALTAFVATLAIGLGVSNECRAITVGQIDDFQDGTSQNWGIGGGFFELIPVDNVADAGPNGTGDNALYMDTMTHGSGAKLLVVNLSQWTGDWTATGVMQVSLDVRNPNASDMALRLGIAGPDGVSGGGSGDTYITAPVSVAADDVWHSITFDVLAANFTALGGSDIAVALADVTHVRILNSALESFIGEIGGAIYLDNILAVGASVPVDGDYNGNGVVDAADYTVWRDTRNQTGPNLPADGNGDMTVDSADYEYWKDRFGNDSGSGAETASGMSFAIPEPAGILLGVMLLLVAALWRWFDLRAATNRR